MNPTRVDHIGIGVPNLEEACKFYEALGLVSGGTEIVADQKVKVAFFPCGDSELELLESTAPDGPIAKFLEKNGGHAGIQHVAIRVPDIRAAIAEMKEKGYRMIDEEPRYGAGGASHRLCTSQEHRRRPHRADPADLSKGRRRQVIWIESKISARDAKRSKPAAAPSGWRSSTLPGKMTAGSASLRCWTPNSFVELDAFVEHRCTNFGMESMEAPGEGVVTGYGTIDNRLVYVYAQDFTVVGGSLGEMHAKKIWKVLDLAMEMGAPVIGLNDSGGARHPGGCGRAGRLRRHLLPQYQGLRRGTPRSPAIMGPCAGGAVYSPALTDFIFMVDKTSNMFITGPQVIKTVTGENVTAEKLGGAMTHNTTSGVAHFVYPTEAETLAAIRKLVGYLPLNNMETAPVVETSDSVNRICDALNSVMPESSITPS